MESAGVDDDASQFTAAYPGPKPPDQAERANGDPTHDGQVGGEPWPPMSVNTPNTTTVSPYAVRPMSGLLEEA